MDKKVQWEECRGLWNVHRNLPYAFSSDGISIPCDKGQRVTDKADVTEGQVVPPPTAPSFWLECLPLCPGLLQVTPDHNPSRDSQKKKIVMQAPEEVLSPHAHAHARRKWETLAFRKVSPIWIFTWPK
ncbi:hypothetical protein RRG08_062034 [Elysia crispata]|uniref:Uncharacterized protein n=1 Tax=Elysia crispata TaxID=231223 RepID=A0AAE1A326_9GAST|nr:hypothetical protein RRG08_062034 [Elysia crispata]